MSTQAAFYVFNHVDKTTRVSLFPLLQFAKYIGFSFFFLLTLPGTALIIAQVLHRWIPYVAYRYGRTGPIWQTPDQLFRLIVFIITMPMLWSTGHVFTQTELVQLLIIFMWCG